jgi:hypothetical protein
VEQGTEEEHDHFHCFGCTVHTDVLTIMTVYWLYQLTIDSEIDLDHTARSTFPSRARHYYSYNMINSQG